MKPVKEGADATAQEEELNRIFLEQEAEREARDAAKQSKRKK